MRSLAIAAATALVFCATSSAQSSRSDDIIVHGQRVDDAMRAFVGEVSVAQTRERQIARWDRKICTRIVGLPTEQAQFLADQIARRAYAVGLAPGAIGCTPNVLLFVARDSDAFARELVERYRVVFDANNVPNMSNLGEAALQDFVATPRAVRWWHVAQTMSADGQRIGNSQPYYDERGRPTNLVILRSNRTFNRFERATRQDFQRAVIIIDASRVRNVSLQALGDYLAMTTLAQLDMTADVGDESILSLFTAPSPATALTAWDVAYLDGLYHAPRNARNYRQQEGAISARMHSALDH